MLSNDDRAKLEVLAAKATDMVDYNDHPTYGHIPAALEIDNRDWGNLADIYASQKLTIVNMLTINALDGKASENARTIQDRIEAETGCTEFSLLKQGNQGFVVLGRSEGRLLAHRVVMHEDLLGSKKTDDAIRAQFPGMLQPLRDAINLNDRVKVEVLPIGQVIELNPEDTYTFYNFTKELCDDTCFNSQAHEIMLQPDGTMTLFDPGECPYVDNFFDKSPEEQQEEIQRSIELVQLRQDSWGVPDQLKWINKDGSLKQDKFFKPLASKHDQNNVPSVESELDNLNNE